MKISIIVTPYKVEEQPLEVGDLVEDGIGIVYIIIYIGEHTYNVLKYGASVNTDCIPKKALKRFYGSVTLTSIR